MIHFNRWLRFNPLSYADVEVKAERAWQHINEKATTIVVQRGSSFLSAQTVRIEYLRGSASGSERYSPLRTAFEADVVIFGIRDHESEDDTDLREGDRFVVNNREIEVTAIVITDGELQAYGRYIS